MDRDSLDVAQQCRLAAPSSLSTFLTGSSRTIPASFNDFVEPSTTSFDFSVNDPAGELETVARDT